MLTRFLLRCRKLPLALLTCLLLVGSTGCDDQEARRQRELQRFREELALERKNARAAVSSRRNWQLAASVLGITGVVLLIAGTAMGSRARKDADRLRGGDET